MLLKNLKMDNIVKNEEIYKSIIFTTSAIFLALVQVYIILLSSGIDIFEFSMIKSMVIRIICKIIVQIIVFGIIYMIVYFIIYRIKTVYWINRHKDLYVKGRWLHIHIKNNVRIGYVDISQNFYEVIARGYNIDLLCQNGENHMTNWVYLMGQVDNDKTARDFIGYYKAHKQEEDITNDGMHALTVTEKREGFPYVMRGNFYDTFKITNESINRILVNEHSGILIFFKPSSACIKYLQSGNNILENIRKLPEVPIFANEEYVKTIKALMHTKKLNIPSKS